MDKILSLLGFIKKAGKLVTGSNAVLRSILNGEAQLVIVTENGGESVKAKFSRLCKENDVIFFTIGSSDQLEKATGERNKVLYSVTDAGFANRLKQLIESLQETNGGAVIE